MKSQFIVFILLSILLTACSPQVTITSEVTVTLPASTETPIPTPTEVPLESLPVEELVQKYLAGEIDDISFLTLEQRNAFRTALAEYLKASGSVHVTFDVGSSNPAYIDPETFAMSQLNDGRSEAEQSIQMNHEVKVDSEGYLWVANLQGEFMRIDGSAGVDWNAIITDPNSTSIDWPNTEPFKSTGLPAAQSFLTSEIEKAYRRVVSLDKTVGNFFFKEFNGGRMAETLRFYQIITDKAGNPLYARVFIAAPAGQITYSEEGSNVEGQSRIISIENTGMHNLLKENSVYWAGIETNQAAITDRPNSSSGYNGVVSETVSGEVLLGTKTDQQNLLVILLRMLIKDN